jgi:hypothetical protein
MNKINATEFSDEFMVLGFDGNVYLSVDGNWQLVMERDLTEMINDVYEQRYTLNLADMCDKVLNTDDVDAEEPISKHILGSANYYVISKTLIAFEIVKAYGYDPFEFFNLPITLGEMVNDGVLERLKDAEMIDMRGLYDPEFAEIMLSYSGEIWTYGTPGTLLYKPEVPITYAEYTESNGLVLYNFLIGYLEQDHEISADYKKLMKKVQFGIIDDDDDTSEEYSHVSINENDFNTWKKIIRVPIHALPESHRNEYSERNYEKIKTTIDKLNEIHTIEEFIRYHLNNGMGVYSILNRLFDLVWPANNLDDVFGSMNLEDEFTIMDGDEIDHGYNHGIKLFCLLENDVAATVNVFCSMWS